MKNKKEIINLISIISNLGFSLTILVFIGYFIGNKLDHYFQSNGLLLALSVIIFILLGFVSFLTFILRILK